MHNEPVLISHVAHPIRKCLAHPITKCLAHPITECLPGWQCLHSDSHIQAPKKAVTVVESKVCQCFSAVCVCVCVCFACFCFLQVSIPQLMTKQNCHSRSVKAWVKRVRKYGRHQQQQYWTLANLARTKPNPVPALVQGLASCQYRGLFQCSQCLASCQYKCLFCYLISQHLSIFLDEIP